MGWNAASSQQHLGSNQNCDKICKQMVDNMKKMNKHTPLEKSQSTPIDKAIEGMSKRFPPKLSHWATGLVSINRKDLFDTFDFGVPMNPGAEQEDILLLYNELNAMPTSRSLSREAEHNGDIPQTTAKEATENCDMMNVVFIKKDQSTTFSQCVALVGGQYQGFHIQRWQRLIGEGAKGKTDRSAPLRLTSRLTFENGYEADIVPSKSHVERHESIMETYFNSLTKIRIELDAILKKIAKSNCVVVMTVNRGQSDLLMNFVCSAKARGFNLDNVIVFPTDTFSRDLADSLGVATYYSHEVSALCHGAILCHQTLFCLCLYSNG